MEFIRGPASALEEKGERNQRGLKKKRASEASVVSGGTIFFLSDPLFPPFFPTAELHFQYSFKNGTHILRI